MLRYTLATMARSRSRLAAAGVAIVIATAFITVALLGNDVVSRTVINSLSVQYAQADLVVLRMNQSASWTEELPLAAEPAAQRPGVAVSLAPYRLWLDLTGPDRQESVLAAAWAPDPALTAVRLVAGQPPRSDRQIVLAQAAADRLGLSLGDAVEVCHQITPPLATEPEGRRVCADFQVSGLSSDDRSLTMPVSAHLSAATGADLAQDMGVEGAPWISLKLTAGADRATVAAAVESAVAAAVAQAVPSDPGSIFVLTPTEAAAQTLDRGLGDRRILTGLALAFAAVALLVAALVIANTFQVLIAQRTRQLALLRCVGADASQLARSVLLEAGLTGLVSSAVGFGVGCALGQGALALAPRFGLSTDLPARIAVSPTTWAVPLLAGLVVTLAAGLAPARLATRVPPVAALSPLPPTDPRRPGGRGRLIWSILLSGLGAALLAGALVASRTTPSQASVGRYYGPLLAGLTGAALILTGLLIGACFWLPRLVAGLGAVLERTGPGARLAVANVRNNPARTTATATALLVGVALVAAMSTGAASLKRSVNDLLDQELPYDLALGATSHDFVRLEPDQPTEPNPATALPADLLRRVEDLDSLTATLSAPGAELDLAGPDGTARLIALGVDLERADQVLRSLEPLRGLDSDSLLLSPWVADQMGWSQGQELTVSGTDGAAVPLRLEVGSSSDLALALVTSDRLAQLAPQAATQQLWGRLAVGADPVALVDDVQRLIDDTANFSAVAALRGTAIERASYERVLDTIAAVAIGLLAVAVLIALIGVANTLSLAVIERRRESALLRALGLTRGQARWMLTVEGVFMAAVAALSGLIVGVALAWAGVGILLGTARGRTLLAVDPVQLGLTGLGAVLAGGLASLLPGASVARTAPAQALTTGQV